MIKDNETRYGTVSRILHWGMALLMLIQLLSATAHMLFDETPFEELLWPTHKPIGFLLLVLIVIRICWVLMNRHHRPSSVSLSAKLGHIALYGLLAVVPALGLLRQYGSGRAFEPFGIPLFGGFEGEKIAWMVQPGNLLHGWLGWILFMMIIGHIFMVILHKRSSTDENVLPRMWR